jgi:hypothetical protein
VGDPTRNQRPLRHLGVLAAALAVVAASAPDGPPPPAEPTTSPIDELDRPPSADGDTQPTAPAPGEPLPAPGPFTLPAGTTPYPRWIPATVLAAYQRARDTMATEQPRCGVPLSLLAAIGKVESGHARGGRVDANGTTLSPILGPVLNGGLYAEIRDTDGGAWDGDDVWDRAVGPMQFIPSTWDRWASDGNADAKANPHNVFDASLASARYLCADGRDLHTPDGIDTAILSYNHSPAYLDLVRRWMSAYDTGYATTPDAAEPEPAAAAAPPPTEPAPAPAPTEPSPAPAPAPPPDTAPAPPPAGSPALVPALVCTVDTVVTTGVGVVGGVVGGLLGSPPPAPTEPTCG